MDWHAILGVFPRYFLLSVSYIGPGSTVALTMIKHLLKMNECRMLCIIKHTVHRTRVTWTVKMSIKPLLIVNFFLNVYMDSGFVSSCG